MNEIMGQSTERKTLNILLVGEGNFSFSACLCDSGKDRIVATCYELEDAISKHPVVWSNVQHLRSRGAEVHFGVDATKLKDFSFVSNQVYDRIIFNFPHCGRKAGVKKNRDLLCSFFYSCDQVLAQKGDIHVALCRGQGGTPADRPMREWHNSWQVVAMAAKAGFLLSAIIPFNAEQYYRYQSTGYRSQDKAFHVEGSLNHVFTRSLPLEDMTAWRLIERLTDSPTSTGNLEYKLGTADRGFFGRESCHPISMLYEELIVSFKSKLQVNVLEDTFPVICDTCSFSRVPHHSVVHNNLYYVMNDNSNIPDHYMLDKQMYTSHQSLKEGHPSAHKSTEQTTKLYYLRPSLTCFVDDLIQKTSFTTSSLSVMSGPVFRKCLISPWTMPVYHEIVLLLGYQDDTLTDQSQKLMDTIVDAVDSVYSGITGPSNDEAENCKNHLKKNILTFHQKSGGDYVITVSPADRDLIIGTIEALPTGNPSKGVGFLLATFNLDLMGMCLLNVVDWRMLWSADERFTQQYNQRRLKTFQSFSLHPPYYIHDVSFWVEGDSVFDEVDFHTIARRLSKETVVSIQLQDKYENVKSGKTGLCYRVTYQSCDRALSYEETSAMQLLLRDELQRCLHVILR